MKSQARASSGVASIFAVGVLISVTALAVTLVFRIVEELIPGAMTPVADASSPATTSAVVLDAPAISLTEEQADALQLQAEEAWQERDWGTAIDSLAVLAAADPHSQQAGDRLCQAHTNYGWALLAEGKTQEAQAHFDLALQIRPAADEAQAGQQLIGQLVSAPASSQPETASNEPACSSPEMGAGDPVCYIVQRGDNLFRLAQRFHTTVEAIKAANHLSSSTILVGQRLVIPICAQPAACVPACPTPCPPVCIPACPEPAPVVCVPVCPPPPPVVCVPVCPPPPPVVCVPVCPPPPPVVCVPACPPVCVPVRDP